MKEKSIAQKIDEFKFSKAVGVYLPECHYVIKCGFNKERKEYECTTYNIAKQKIEVVLSTIEDKDSLTGECYPYKIRRDKKDGMLHIAEIDDGTCIKTLAYAKYSKKRAEDLLCELKRVLDIYEDSNKKPNFVFNEVVQAVNLLEELVMNNTSYWKENFKEYQTIFRYEIGKIY